MAISIVTIGGAMESEKGGKYGNPGDSRQSATETKDLIGEVSLRELTEAQFKKRYAGYNVYRPKDPGSAHGGARLMIIACNNPNVGYSQDSTQFGRTSIFKYGAESATPINCDCSSLVSYCITQGMGISISQPETQYTGSLGRAMDSSGQFMASFPASNISFESNPPYTGDVMLTSGHVEMIVAGSPREGKEDEITTGTWSGEGDQIEQYRNVFGELLQFTPRQSEPQPTDEFYEFYNQSNGISANGSYAWGRFSEIMQSNCDLCRGPARKWYGYKEDGYARGAATAPGAVMCYTNILNTEDLGIVQVVEKLDNENNLIYVSQRNPKTGVFEYLKKEKRYGSWDMDLDGDGKFEYVFQGFIYNPSVNMGQETFNLNEMFVDNARAQVGNNGSYVTQFTGLQLTAGQAWSAAFITAVASETGSLLNILIPNTYSCSDIGRIAIVRGMGTWYDGPASGGKPYVEKGDIILLRTGNIGDRANKYAADKAGIVCSISADRSKTLGTNEDNSYAFNAIVGDCEGSVKERTYTTGSKQLSGVFRPDWNRVDGSTQSIEQYYIFEGIYTEGTSREDAAVRDLRWVKLGDTGFEPSIKSEGLRLAAINYTGMLANFYSSLAEVGSSAATDSNLVVDMWTNTSQSQFQVSTENYVETLSESAYSQVDVSSLDLDDINSTGGPVQTKKGPMYLDSNSKTLYGLLNAHLQNPATTIGIMGNMWQESGWLTNAYNKKDGGSGLIQWTDTSSSPRCTNMRNYCKTHGNNSNWDSNLTAQVDYIFEEARTIKNIGTAIAEARQVSKNLEGAKLACKTFFQKVELVNTKLFNTSYGLSELSNRQSYTEAAWKLFFGGKA